jgi:glycosyltransferase involved in cell wall biosynthesis
MKVSVAIPVFNGMPFIVETIESILNSDYSDYEIVISDDSSNDGTSEWLQSLRDKRIKLINPPSRLSMAENWDFVVKSCQGDYIKLISADDVITTGGLRNQVEILDRHPSVSAVFSSRQIIDSKGKTIVKRLGFGRMEGEFHTREVMKISLLKGRNCFGETCAGLVRSLDLKHNSLKSSSFSYLLDMSLYHDVLDGKKVYISPRVDSKFRIQENSLSVKSVNSHAKQFMAFRDYVCENYTGSEFAFSRKERILSSLNSIKNMQLRKIIYTYLNSRKGKIMENQS